MDVLSSEWRDRIAHWIRTLKQDFYSPLGEIGWEAFRTRDHLSSRELESCEFVPVNPGFTWGETWEYCWFRGRVTLPEAAQGKRIVLNLSPGGESTLFVNGRSFGTYRADWVSEPHHYLVDNALTAQGRAGDCYEVLMETYAGHYYPDMGLCATGPVLPGAYQDPLPEGARRTLGQCTYGVWNEDAYQLYMDVDTLSKLLDVLDSASLRAAKVAEALEQFTLMVDFEQDAEKRTASYRAASQMLRLVLEAVNGSTQPVFYAVGNAHLDLAWLWPMAETHRKTARTFAAQLRLLEEYPDYKFIQSQPASYEMCRTHYPELFQRIREAVKAGRWIADGAMWVEPDTNMAGGEALIRQLLHGKRYYKEVFDVDSKLLWLAHLRLYGGPAPDSQGLRRGLPGDPENFLVLQPGGAVPLPLLLLAGAGRLPGHLLPAHQLHLPDPPRRDQYVVEEQNPDPRLGRLPPALRLRRRGRRAHQGSCGVRPAPEGSGGRRAGEAGGAHGIF